MQKIVVGIIAVFFVQIGFQVYSAVDGTNYAYRSVTIPAAPNGVQEVVSPAPNVEELYLASIRPENTIHPAQNAVVRSRDRQVFRAQTARFVKPRSASVTPTFVAQDVVITIPKQVVPTYTYIGAPKPAPPVYSSTTAIGSASPKAEKRTEKKRSFLSKVIRKPFDWMKTVAMKLK